jgi:hypothetical protein
MINSNVSSDAVAAEDDQQLCELGVGRATPMSQRG